MLSEFVVTQKSKISRIIPAIEFELLQNSSFKVLGLGQGSVKAVVLCEKLKKTHPHLSQSISISTRENIPVLEFTLTAN